MQYTYYLSFELYLRYYDYFYNDKSELPIYWENKTQETRDSSEDKSDITRSKLWYITKSIVTNNAMIFSEFVSDASVK